MNLIESQMASGDCHENIINKYGKLQSLFEHYGGYEIQEKLSRVCTGLKLSEDFKKRFFNTLSGGEKTTVVLGKILLENPDILLLDEPTNHLDIESVEWLESYIRSYAGTVLIISHDRYFLDMVTNKIIEIEDDECASYKGNYSDFVKEKDRLMMLQFEAFEDQQKKIKEMEKTIKTLRDWAARGDNPKFYKKAASIQKRLDKMTRIERPQFERDKIQLCFTGSDRCGNDVIIMKGLSKSFGNNEVLKNLNFTVKYRQRAAILGKNGCGKSTLFKILMGEYPPDTGEAVFGASVMPAYLEQNIHFENEELTVIDTFRENLNILEGPARGILAKFLFYGEDVFKKVKGLSGGEKSRLKLCMLIQEDINTLILDEPTNHLDIDSREMLEEAMENFKGTILFVSHDRYFINKIATRIIEFNNGGIWDFNGRYEEYKEKKLQNCLMEEQKKEDVIIESKNNKEAIEKDVPIKKNEFKIKRMEEKINELEENLSNNSLNLEKYSSDFSKLTELLSEKDMLQSELDIAMEEWLNYIQE
jgi:ATPase subunit of ABC transporter with duplicated ATPase domains